MADFDNRVALGGWSLREYEAERRARAERKANFIYWLLYYQRAAEAAFKASVRYREAKRPWLADVYGEAARKNYRQARRRLTALINFEQKERKANDRITV